MCDQQLCVFAESCRTASCRTASYRNMCESTFRILLGDHESTFEALFAKNDETNIHTQNLRVLMIEKYKTLNANPPFMQESFIGKDVKYDLRTRNLLQIPAANSIRGCSIITSR